MNICSLLLVILLSLSADESVFSLGASGMLPNGMEIVLVRIPGMPVVSASVHVNVGTEFEDSKTSGATHLLEHLLFNGTSSKTQSELYKQMDLDGLYINAATRSTGTIFIGLCPRDQIYSLLSTESEMLFDSVIPEEKFDKERRIVLEEIAQYGSYPDAVVSEWVFSRVFRGSPYALPSMGTERSLSELTRDDVYAYYKKHYVPNNSTLYLIGDFDWPDIWDLLKETFGVYKPGSLPERPELSVPIIESLVSDTMYAPVMAPKLILAFGSPDPGDEGFAAVHLACPSMEDYLSTHVDSLIRDAGIEHILRSGMSRILFTLELADSTCASDVLAAMNAILDGSIQYLSVPDRFHGMKKEWHGNLLRSLERPHMFTLFFEDLLSALGWEGMENLASSISLLESESFSESLRLWFTEREFVSFLVLPGADSSEIIGDEKEPILGNREIVPSIQPRVIRERLPNVSEEMMAPSFSRLVSDTTDNGMIISIRQRPGITVSGLHILFRERNAYESEDRYGSAEIMHRLFGTGPSSMPADAFTDTLNGMGVEIQVTDNPMIPFDDYYYSARWGYLRLTSPDDAFLRSAALLRDVLIDPRFDKSQIQHEKMTLKRLLRHRNRIPRNRARTLLMRKFLPGSPYARSPMGTPGSIDSITVADLRDFYSRYVRPENMIITVCTSEDPEMIADSVRTLFSHISSDGTLPSQPEITPRPGPWVSEDSLGTGQSYVITLMSFPAERREQAAVKILAEILDRRMSWLIREERGLSYSLGASSGFLGKYGWIIASVGTKPESILETESCLKRLIAELTTHPVKNKDEFRTAARSLERRELLRRLTRTGEAMAMATALMDGQIPRRVEEEMVDYFHVSTSDLLKVASRLDREKQGWVIVH